MTSRRLLVTDPTSCSLLYNDRTSRMVEKCRELKGFELYIVEQWACTRTSCTIAISTFTGQAHHKILVTVFDIPSTESEWSQAIRDYMRFVERHHAKSHETPVGMIMVTNLSTFPSTLNIIGIPDGNIMRHEHAFFINENLKRMGCSGRAGMNIMSPPETTLTKFRTTYRISERVVTVEAVLELVRACQLALTMFLKLDQSYCDGLLCDETTKALSDWWTDIGLQNYAIEPSDGILGATTVSALLGLYLGSRNRLQACGTPMPKDAFEIASFKHGISHFQKSRGLDRTRCLDHRTLQKLQRVTAKAANSEGWAVPRAVKSTVAELGKGGEMVMGMVGAKDRAGIAEIETPDIDQFAKKVSGATCKWLWKGKARKTSFRKQITAPDEKFGFNLHHSRSQITESSSSDDAEANSQANTHAVNSTDASYLKAPTSPTRGFPIPRMVFGKVGERVGEAKSNMHRIRGATENEFKNASSNCQQDAPNDEGSSVHRHSGPSSLNHLSDISVRADPVKFAHRSKCESKAANEDEPRDDTESVSSTRQNDCPCVFTNSQSKDHADAITNQVVEYQTSMLWKGAFKRSNSAEQLSPERCGMSNSIGDLADITLSEDTCEHTLSFVLGGNMDHEERAVYVHMTKEQADILRVSRLLGSSSYLIREYSSTMKSKMYHIKDIGDKMHWLQQDIQQLRNTKAKQAEVDTQGSEEVIRDAKEFLLERLHEIDALGSKLEYEIGVLESRIEDVETGVTDLDRQVSDLESRSRQLNADLQPHNWQQRVAALIHRIGLL